MFVKLYSCRNTYNILNCLTKLEKIKIDIYINIMFYIDKIFDPIDLIIIKDKMRFITLLWNVTSDVTAKLFDKSNKLDKWIVLYN